MLSAFATSALFLGCYLWYHAHHGVKGEIRGTARTWDVLCAWAACDPWLRSTARARPEAYTSLIAPDELLGVPRVRWCSEATCHSLP